MDSTIQQLTHVVLGKHYHGCRRVSCFGAKMTSWFVRLSLHYCMPFDSEMNWGIYHWRWRALKSSLSQVPENPLPNSASTRKCSGLDDLTSNVCKSVSPNPLHGCDSSPTWLWHCPKDSLDSGCDNVPGIFFTVVVTWSQAISWLWLWHCPKNSWQWLWHQPHCLDSAKRLVSLSSVQPWLWSFS